MAAGLSESADPAPADGGSLGAACLESWLSAYLNRADVQKALGDYLERQRRAFSRFYFVGDEDLLEIIGNAKEPVKVSRHLAKMFACISALDLGFEDDGADHDGEQPTRARAMISKEGESIAFSSAVYLGKGGSRSVKEWLGEVEQQMKLTLASVLEAAVGEPLGALLAGSLPF